MLCGFRSTTPAPERGTISHRHEGQSLAHVQFVLWGENDAKYTSSEKSALEFHLAEKLISKFEDSWAEEKLYKLRIAHLQMLCTICPWRSSEWLLHACIPMRHTLPFSPWGVTILHYPWSFAVVRNDDLAFQMWLIHRPCFLLSYMAWQA